jgi:valyl-tRNA synthetase
MQKGRLDGEDAADRADATAVLAWVFERTLRLLHPTMPFITEEIRRRFADGDGSIALAPWPDAVDAHADPDAERSFAIVQGAITAIRQFRSRHRIAPSARFEAVAGVPEDAIDAVAELGERVERLAGVTPLRVVAKAVDRAAGWTAIAFDDGWVTVPPGLFDADEERNRLRRERDDASAQLERSRTKLANEGFRAKAAPEVVAQEQDRSQRLTQQLAELESQLAELG